MNIVGQFQLTHGTGLNIKKTIIIVYVNVLTGTKVPASFLW
jgi:hypothetical protein